MECFMRRLFFVLLVLLLLIPMGVSAQEAIVFDTLQVEFWPEYDRPEMLVVYTIDLSPETVLPATLSFRIPTAAGEPFVIFDEGVGEPDYQRQVEGDWSVITFTAGSLNLRMEYYDPGLTKDGSSRSFNYTWPGDYAVNSFQVYVQRPFDASALQTRPVLGEKQTSVTGLSYYYDDFGRVNSGQQTTVAIEYEKPSDILTEDGLAQQPPATDDSSTDTNDWLIALLGFVGVGIIGYGVYSYTQGSSSRRRSRSARQKRARSGGAQGKVFCHHCGTQARKGAKFCRECGKKLRV
jgi:hypothetical protein